MRSSRKNAEYEIDGYLGLSRRVEGSIEMKSTHYGSFREKECLHWVS